MIISTDFALQNQRQAAEWLGTSMNELRRLRREGGGPRYVTLPNGEVKYRVEDLHAWAFGESASDVVHVYVGGAKIIPFPGVRVRKHLPPDDQPPMPRRRKRLSDDLGGAS